MAPRKLLFSAVLALYGALRTNAGVAADPVVQTYPIDYDTRIDSYSPTYNYGVSTSCRVIVNGNNGSLVRSLFELPDAMWSIPSGQALVSAKVYFYAKQENIAERTVRFYPLSRRFEEGSGDATASGDGATWLTYDGVHAWTNPGGDYDTGTFATAIKSGSWYVWDITTMWASSGLREFGAMLRMNDESNPGPLNQPRVTFSSSDDAADYRPYVEVITIPEPVSLAAFVLLGGLGISARRRPRPNS